LENSSISPQTRSSSLISSPASSVPQASRQSQSQSLAVLSLSQSTCPLFIQPGTRQGPQQGSQMYVLPSPFFHHLLITRAPQTGSQRTSKQAGSLPPCGCAFSILLLTWFPNVTQANTSSTSPSSSSAARPILNDVASSLKRPPLDDRHISYSLILFARYNPLTLFRVPSSPPRTLSS
jgi:hypothetical protein